MRLCARARARACVCVHTTVEYMRVLETKSQDRRASRCCMTATAAAADAAGPHTGPSLLRGPLRPCARQIGREHLLGNKTSPSLLPAPLDLPHDGSKSRVRCRWRIHQPSAAAFTCVHTVPHHACLSSALPPVSACCLFQAPASTPVPDSTTQRGCGLASADERSHTLEAANVVDPDRRSPGARTRHKPSHSLHTHPPFPSSGSFVHARRK